MKLEWVPHESGRENDLEAVGSGKRYYQVWYECNQHIADVDDCPIGYGNREYCIKACQEHEDGVS